MRSDKGMYIQQRSNLNESRHSLRNQSEHGMTRHVPGIYVNRPFCLIYEEQSLSQGYSVLPLEHMLPSTHCAAAAGGEALASVM